MKELFMKYKEIINYIIFGGISTAVSFVTYWIFARGFYIDEVVSNVLSWFCAVLFAYVTNKIWVFESKTETKKAFMKEITMFFSARIISGLLCDVGIFTILVKGLKINDIVSKVSTQIIIIIMNYVFSKLIVFRKKKENSNA